MRRLAPGAILVAVLTLRSAVVLACDCPVPPSTETALAAASAVVVASVARIERDAQPPSKMTPIDGGWALSDIVPSGEVRIHLAVSRAWKGARPGETITVRRRVAEISDCAYPLEVGTTHLLFLRPELAVKGASLDAAAAHCGRSRPASEAAEEIARLDRLAPADGTASGPSAQAPRRGCGCTSAAGGGTTRGELFVGLAVIAWVRSRRRGAVGRGLFSQTR